MLCVQGESTCGFEDTSFEKAPSGDLGGAVCDMISTSPNPQ